MGGVILFGSNVTTPAALTALARSLRDAAAAGGEPPLLIATDQEGGSVKRVPSAPPTLAPPALGDLGGASGVRSEGVSTGAALRDLAMMSTSRPLPMSRRPTTHSCTSRAGPGRQPDRDHDPGERVRLGLESEGVLPVMKHFPGLGFATLNTDTHVVTLTDSIAALAPGLRPYRTAIADRCRDHAVQRHVHRLRPAPRGRLVPCHRDHAAPAGPGVHWCDHHGLPDRRRAARGVSAAQLAIDAAGAGTDMILLTGSEASTRAAYAALVTAAEDGTIPAATLIASYTRILVLKSRL